jgi:hypothetical protein
MTIRTEASGFDQGTVTSGPLPAVSLNRTGVIKVELDWAAISAARTAAGQTAVGAGDGVAAIAIPANTFVHAVGVNVTTAEGGTLTIDIGDGTDPDGWIDGVDGNAVAAYAPTHVLTEGTPNVIIGYGKGKLYTADDTIDVITVNAADTAVMTVWAVCSYVG